MSRGHHSTDDRSFSRSTGLALGRGLVLLAVAVVVGIVLLNSVPTPTPKVPASTPPSPTSTVPAKHHGTTTTTVPPATSTTLAPSKVAVLVANGTSVAKGATNLSNALKPLGYKLLAPVDTTSAATGSAVYFAPGYDQAAASLAQLMKLSPSSVQPLPSSLPVASVSGADVVVVEGPTLAQRFTNPTSIAPPSGGTTSGGSATSTPGGTTSSTAGSTTTGS